MDTHLQLLQRYRPKLFGLAYRMLGSRADVEDVLQETYLRFREADLTQIASHEAWLKTATSRLSIDRLRRLKTEREAYSGPWLPEPLTEQQVSTPEMAAELRDDISIAFLKLLETLTPEERAAFVLHDVLDDDYADIAEALGKSQASCRQLVHRARERVLSDRRRFQVDDATRERMLRRFIEIADRGDRAELVNLFARDAVMIADGGGKATAVRRPLFGANRISMLWYAVAKNRSVEGERRLVRVNGELAVANYFRGRLHSVATIDTDGVHIYAYYSVVNPDKLSAFTAS